MDVNGACGLSLPSTYSADPLRTFAGARREFMWPYSPQGDLDPLNKTTRLTTLILQLQL